MKKNTKTTSKAKKPAFIADFTNVHSAEDMYAEIALAKQRAGLPMLNIELDSLISVMIKIALGALSSAIATCSTGIEISGDEKLVFDAQGNVSIKKPNIFKRFWNWIRRK